VQVSASEHSPPALHETCRRACSATVPNPAWRAKKKRQFSREDCRFFVLFTFLFSFFSLLSNCRFQIKDKREEIKEKVALLRKALI
jgi:hypothetical protein